MMKNALLLVPLAMGVIDSAVANEIADDAGVMSIFKTPALLEIQFATENPFSTEQIYHIEEITALYLRELLTNDDSLTFLDEPDSVIDVSVNAQTQQVYGNEISFGAKVDVTHYGEVGITDVAALLAYLVNQNNTDSSFIYLDHILRADASVELISFDYISESIPVATNLTTASTLIEIKNAKKYGSEKTLLVVTTLLSITLFGMSAILIWVGGGWLSLRKKVRDLVLREEELTRMTMNIVSKPTADTQDGDEEDSPRGGYDASQFSNPSAIHGSYNRGARPNMYGLGVKTPSKMISGSASELATPMSVMSEYSDTDRAPIGIMSMRKLVPPREQDDDEDTRTENMSSSRSDLNSMKKLEY